MYDSFFNEIYHLVFRPLHDPRLDGGAQAVVTRGSVASLLIWRELGVG